MGIRSYKHRWPEIKPIQLRVVINEAGITQDQAADLMLCAKQSVVDWLSGKVPVNRVYFELLLFKLNWERYGYTLLKQYELTPQDKPKLAEEDWQERYECAWDDTLMLLGEAATKYNVPLKALKKAIKDKKLRSYRRTNRVYVIKNAVVFWTSEYHKALTTS